MILNNESLTKWIEENLLNVTVINERSIEIDDVGKFLLVEPKNITVYFDNGAEYRENVIFDNDFQIQLNPIEDKYCDTVDYLLFEFGDRWYYTDSLNPDEIKVFKYLGKVFSIFTDIELPHLGVHGGYELSVGSRDYKDWCKKASFLNVKTLGICEQNTLAGTLAFQAACLKDKIKPIIGETITILTESKAKVAVKLFAKNEEGWKNLLLINSYINVNNNGEFIDEHQLFKADGLICVLSPEVDLSQHISLFTKYFSNIYFQIDFAEWSGYDKDKQWLTSLKYYINNYFKKPENKLLPVLISDSYYLDKADSNIKMILSSVAKIGFKSQSDDQYFKSTDEIFLQTMELFSKTDDTSVLILEEATKNTNTICAEINFQIVTGKFRLPDYEMNKEEMLGFTSNEELFWSMIDKGLETLIFDKVTDVDVYIDRVAEEVDVIKRGGFIDYFLILADLVRWCGENDIWVGMGRGSAAGSLVSYLLGVVLIDPIKYRLLFSRFLNAGRLGKSLPDVDLDFQSNRRDDVKKYIESKYGVEYVASIGAYGTMKIKSSLKDLCRNKGLDYSKTNYFVSLIESESTFTDLFKVAAVKEDFRSFVQKNHEIVETLPLCINQPKNATIHASGVIVVPKEHGTIFEQMPVKKIDDQIVSEWEGEFLDKAGFLKFDILGVKQLDKFSAITKLIKEHTGKVITYQSMTLDDPDVMDLFKQGLTEDVFQFGTQGLKVYCKELQPDNIEDLIAATSLYRPGAMESGAHKKYIRVKNKLETLIFDEGTEDITKDTYGIIVYQEQVMQICVHMAGFDLVQSDDIRKAMGKKDIVILLEYKDKFINGCLANGYTKSKVIALWDKMESFASYAFNRSHAAAYTVMGYFSQWLKYNYPIQFWTVSMQFADEKDIINRISEINKVSTIEVASVDINKSTTVFFAENDIIYWNLNSVKWVGDKAVAEILHERMYVGEFFSIEDFCERLAGRSVNKRCIINLILAGAFDKTEKIIPSQRHQLLVKYHSFTNNKMNDEISESKGWKDYQWILKQKELTGFGVIEYPRIIKSSSIFAPHFKKFKENAEVLTVDSENLTNEVVVSGIVQSVIERKSKKGVFGQVEIIDNTDTIYITLWNEAYEPIKRELEAAKNSIIIISGIVKFDSYKQSNVLHSSKKTLIEII